MWRWRESNPRPKKEQYMILRHLVNFLYLKEKPIKPTKQFFFDPFYLDNYTGRDNYRFSVNDTSSIPREEE